MKSRLRILRKFRGLLAEQSLKLAELCSKRRQRPVEEILTAEVIPLLESIKFLEREAEALLAPRRLGRRGRPAWLMSVASEVRREPLGMILIIGPSNYPLFLPSIQAVQALVAGNAVVVKPGVGGLEVMECVVSLLHHAGLDHRIVQILPEDASWAVATADVGVDKVVLTGSARTGEVVLGQLARKGTPSVMELSGCDAVIVRSDADLDLTTRALRFGALLNNGATCIAPRRVFVHRCIATELEGRLSEAFATDDGPRQPVPLKPEWIRIIREALSDGAHLVSGTLLDDEHCLAPLVLAGALPEMQLLQEDVFAPVMGLVTVSDDHEALELSRRCPFALGATIFSRDQAAALRLAGSLQAGVVVINDMIVPTADPRLPFAARGRSGFGATRGPEGLLEMTTPKAIAVRRSSWLPHLEPSHPDDAFLFENYVVAANATNWISRLRAGLRLVRGLTQRNRTN